MYQKMSLDAYRISFLRVISVIIEIINYPFKLGENAFQAPILFERVYVLYFAWFLHAHLNSDSAVS
jgi:hypothetical protein